MDQSHQDDQTQSIFVLTAGVTVSRYTILEKIGAGGMGEVYLAEDKVLKRKVALKFLPTTYSKDEAFRERFLREAQSAAALNHPNIITIHEIDEFQDHLYIAMEYLVGQPLTKVIEAGKSDLDKNLELITQIALGLKKAHEAGIVHRDIKPDNIIVTNEGHVKILDFGLAKGDSDSNLTQVGQVMGTVNYMSPEQSQGREIDARGDIFSVGVVFYEMLTGIKPFKKDNIPATLNAIVNEPTVRIAQYSPHYPSGLQQIMDKALAKLVDERYQTLGDFIEDLRRLESGQKIAPPVQTVSITPEPVEIKSLAVLYLRNLGSADDDFLCYGITEDLIVDLSRIGSIRVAAMRSIMKYKESDEELEVLAEKLGVEMILDGSIHRGPESIRVSAQLVQVSTGENIWAQRWEESLDNLPQIKKALASGISSALNVDHSQNVKAQIGESETSNPEAYEYYLRGKYVFDHKKDTADIGVAIELYNQALKLEPMLLSAKAGLAEAHIHMGDFDEANIELITAAAAAHKLNRPADEATILCLAAKSHEFQSRWDEAENEALSALEIIKGLGNLSGEAEVLGTIIQINLRRAKFSKSLEMYERVLEINRKLGDKNKAAVALKNMGNIFHRMGKYIQARSLYEEALDIARLRQDHALEAACLSNIGISLYYMGELDDALRHYEDALKIDMYLDDPTGMATRYNNIAIVHLSRGSFRKAISNFEKASVRYDKLGEMGSYALAYNNISGVLVTLGEYDQAVEISEKALELGKELDYPLAIIYAYDYLSLSNYYSGNSEKALEYANIALIKGEKSELKRNEAFTCSNLAEFYFLESNYEQCRLFCERAYKISDELDKKDTKLKVEIYLAYLDIDEKQIEAGISKLRELVEKAMSQPDPIFILLSQRLLGQALIKFGTGENNKQEAEEILSGALKLATMKEVAYETKFISQLLEELKT